MRACLGSILLVFISLTSTSQEYIAAHPRGGKQQMHYFIDQELIYPELSLINGIEGKVSFKFTIDEKGIPREFNNIVYPDSLTLQETQRIFSLIEWLPATLGGVSVKDIGHFEIDFSIKKYKRLCKTRGYSQILNPYEPVDSSGKIFWYRNLHKAPYPIFADNRQTLSSFIAEHLVYPELAIRQNISGVVTLNFVIETNGRISNLEIQNSVGAGCNEEAIRLLRKIKWMPGLYDDKAVRTRTSMSVTFSLDPAGNGNFNPVVKSSYGG